MPSWRYWFHIRESQQFIRRIYGIPTNWNVRFRDFWGPQHLMFENGLGMFLKNWSNFGGSKVENNGFWESWSCPLCPKVMEMRIVGVFGKWNRKATSPIWSRIILRSFWATVIKMYSKNGAQIPADPKTGFVHKSLLDPLWIPYRSPIRCTPTIVFHEFVVFWLLEKMFEVVDTARVFGTMF